jgi:hypothetical protein
MCACVTLKDGTEDKGEDCIMSFKKGSGTVGCSSFHSKNSFNGKNCTQQCARLYCHEATVWRCIGCSRTLMECDIYGMCKCIVLGQPLRACIMTSRFSGASSARGDVLAQSWQEFLASFACRGGKGIAKWAQQGCPWTGPIHIKPVSYPICGCTEGQCQRKNF